MWILNYLKIPLARTSRVEVRAGSGVQKVRYLVVSSTPGFTQELRNTEGREPDTAVCLVQEI